MKPVGNGRKGWFSQGEKNPNHQIIFLILISNRQNWAKLLWYNISCVYSSVYSLASHLLEGKWDWGLYSVSQEWLSQMWYHQSSEKHCMHSVPWTCMHIKNIFAEFASSWMLEVSAREQPKKFSCLRSWARWHPTPTSMCPKGHCALQNQVASLFQ